MPDGEVRGAAIFAHCFTCSKNYKVIANIGKILNQGHFALFRFDFAGLGESKGEFSRTTFTSNVQDVVAASRWLESQGIDPTILMGHSLGGAAVLAAAEQLPKALAVAVLCAPSDTIHLKQYLPQEFGEDGTTELRIGGRPLRLAQGFVDDLDKHDIQKHVANLNRPLMIFHPTNDPTVPIQHAEKNFASAKHPKSFVTLPQADHLVSDQQSSQLVGRMVIEWVSQFLKD
ncbi:MAG: alpha/beta hydrolase family protein [Gemmataceae bacterium]